MRPPVRFGAAVLAGLLAAAVAFVAARPVVDGTQATAVAAANAAVWTGAAAVYLRVYGRFGGAPAASGDVDQYVQLKWGGMGGVVGSLGIAGPAVLLADVAPMRYAGALALFAFGLVVFSLSVGMATVAARFEDADAGPGTDRNGDGADREASADD